MPYAFDPDMNGPPLSPGAAHALVHVMPVTMLTYVATATDWVYLCTEWTLTDALGSTVTLYWDAPSGLWTPIPANATCALASFGLMRNVTPVFETAP